MTDIPSPQQRIAQSDLADLRRIAGDVMQKQFGSSGHVSAAAPGRVNLIGEHIDYNDGFVLPMAIERYISMVASPATDANQQTARVFSVNLDRHVDIELGDLDGPTTDGWGRYIQGVCVGFARRGVQVPAFNAVIASNVPQGGGLSSSAALEVATATMLEGLTGHQLTPLEKAQLCQTAEHEFAGVPCGIMDQYSSVFGQPDRLLLIDCQSQECEMVPFDSSGVSILIANSNVKHALTGGEYAQRRSQCDEALKIIGKSSWRDVATSDIESSRDRLSDDQFKRASHVVSEITRTTAAAQAFQASDWPTAGELMYQSHRSLRDDFEVSCHELDVLVEIASSIGRTGGVIGSRMTGGGFGGSTVSLVENEKLAEVIQTMTKQYKQSTGIDCECFASRPALGAHLS